MQYPTLSYFAIDEDNIPRPFSKMRTCIKSFPLTGPRPLVGPIVLLVVTRMKMRLRKPLRQRNCSKTVAALLAGDHWQPQRYATSSDRAL